MNCDCLSVRVFLKRRIDIARLPRVAHLTEWRDYLDHDYFTRQARGTLEHDICIARAISHRFFDVVKGASRLLEQKSYGSGDANIMLEVRRDCRASLPRKVNMIEVVSRLSAPRGVPRKAASQCRYTASRSEIRVFILT